MLDLLSTQPPGVVCVHVCVCVGGGGGALKMPMQVNQNPDMMMFSEKPKLNYDNSVGLPWEYYRFWSKVSESQWDHNRYTQMVSILIN